MTNTAHDSGRSALVESDGAASPPTSCATAYALDTGASPRFWWTATLGVIHVNAPLPFTPGSA